MKLIQVCNVFYPAPLFGTELVAYKIAKKALARGFEADIITSNLESFSPIKRLNNSDIEIFEGIRIIRCKANMFPKVFPVIIPSLMHTLREAISPSKESTIIHSHTYLSLNSFFAAVVGAFGDGAKLIHQPHYHPFPGGSFKGYMARRICDHSIGNFILRNADAIVVMSKAEMGELKQYNRIDNGKIRIIPHGIDEPILENKVDIGAFKRAYCLDKNDIVLLCVSRIGEKIVDFFISLLTRLDKRIKAILVGSLWGNVNRTKILKRIEKSGMTNRLMLTGYLKREMLSVAYSSADVFVKPAYFFEAFGIAFIEAMSYGLPIVTHKIGALSEIIEDDRNGFLVNHSNNEIDDFETKINLLLEDKGIYGRISNRNRKKAGDWLWDNILDCYFELYEEVMKGSE